MASIYDKMSLEDLSTLIGNKQKATDIYNQTGSWDSDEISKYSQANNAIRQKYGITEDIDLATANNIFNQKFSNYTPTTSTDKPLINMQKDPYTATPASNKERQGMYQQREDYASDKMDDFLYGNGSQKALDSPIMSNIMDYYNKQGDKAYENTLGNLASFTGGRLNSWAARGAAGAKNDYTQAGSQMAPRIIGMVGDMYSNNRNFYAGRESEMYDRQQTEQQQKFNNDMALSQLMGGATYGLRQYANPYLNPDGTPINHNMDYQAMINSLDPNDPDYAQKKYQLEQARYAKVQLPEYQQYAQGVTAPIQAAPIWSANPANPTNQAQIISNYLTGTYGPEEYQAKIAAQNIANEGGTLQNQLTKDYGAKQAQAEIDSVYNDMAIKKQNANTAAYKAKNPSSGSGGGTSAKPAITTTTAINEIQSFLNKAKEDEYDSGNAIDKTIEYAMSLENLGYNLDQIESILLAAGVSQNDINTYVDKKIYPSRYDQNTYGPILAPRENIKTTDTNNNGAWWNPFNWFK